MRIEYYNLYTHFVFVTQGRIAMIKPQHRERIEKYITGIVNNKDCKLYAIYANPEHIHFLISRSPDISEETIASIVGNSSAKFINDYSLCSGKFSWQQSASAFSVSKGDIENVCRYIFNQPEHHQKKSFEDEYQEFIRYYQKPINPGNR
jgi:putative transposase